MQHIVFFIENCIKWAENYYLGHFIIGEGNYYPRTKKKLCSILLHTCSIQIQNTASLIFLWLLVQIDWKSLLDTFLNRKGWLSSKIHKKNHCCSILLHDCCIEAKNTAYWILLKIATNGPKIIIWDILLLRRASIIQNTLKNHHCCKLLHKD